MKEEKRKGIFAPDKRIILPDGKRKNDNVRTVTPEEGIASILRTYMTLSGNMIKNMGELAKALGAAYRRGVYQSVLGHHVNVLNCIVRTKIPDWIDPKSDDPEMKKCYEAASQMKQLIINSINGMMKPDGNKKSREQVQTVHEGREESVGDASNKDSSEGAGGCDQHKQASPQEGTIVQEQ